jgi:hypothetical protein
MANMKILRNVNITLIMIMQRLMYTCSVRLIKTNGKTMHINIISILRASTGNIIIHVISNIHFCINIF